MRIEDIKKPKPVFIIKKIMGENMEELCDNLWDQLSEMEKLRVLENGGYKLNN